MPFLRDMSTMLDKLCFFDTRLWPWTRVHSWRPHDLQNLCLVDISLACFDSRRLWSISHDTTRLDRSSKPPLWSVDITFLASSDHVICLLCVYLILHFKFWIYLERDQPYLTRVSATAEGSPGRLSIGISDFSRFCSFVYIFFLFLFPFSLAICDVVTREETTELRRPEPDTRTTNEMRCKCCGNRTHLPTYFSPDTGIVPLTCCCFCL